MALAAGALVLAGVGWMKAPEPIAYEAGLFDDITCDISNPAFERCQAWRRERLDRQIKYEVNRDAIQRPYNLLAFAFGSAVVGALWFVVFWAIGWVLAGFARDDERPV